jgi:hypothetical protein
MRWLLPLLVLLPGPLSAWEFTPSPICTLNHADDAVAVVVTYDPAVPEYTISLTLSEGAWPRAPRFAIAFEGAGGLVITTDRHERSEDGRTLSVKDRGFGNVLLGLESGGLGVARAGGTAASFALDGAAPAVAAFRACPAAATS